MSERPSENLADLVDELEETLEALRAEIESPRPPGRRGRPPSPGELLRIVDEYAIPAGIAALEANIRALEFLQAGIRARERDTDGEGTADAVEEGNSAVSRATLDRLDRVLGELEASMEGSGVPGNREARNLLTEARRLNEEVADRLAVASSAGEEEAVRIEVESELDAIREEVSGEDGAEADDTEE